ncbi:MAG: sigma-54 dependent transcriptional regulator [Vicinamibacterales bacterium]
MEAATILRRPLVGSGAIESRACEERIAAGDATLVDWGAEGQVWFEARCPAADGWPAVTVDSAVMETLARRADVVCPAGVRLLRLPDAIRDAGPRAASDLARALRRIGYVLVGTGAGRTRRLARWLGRRHLAILLTADRDRELALAWLRGLAGSSLRAHLLIDARPAPTRLWDDRPADRAVARERATVYGAAGAPVAPPMATGRASVRMRRAASLARRGRLASAARWHGAAVSAPGARLGTRGDLAAATDVVVGLLRSGRPEAAAKAAARAGDVAAGVDARSRFATLAADAWLLAGEPARAAQVLSLVEVAAALDRRPVAEQVRAAGARLRFWTGRMEEAIRLLDASGADGTGIETRLWRAVVSRFGEGPVAASEAAAFALRAPDLDVVGPRWRRLLQVLAGEARPEETTPPAPEVALAVAAPGESVVLEAVGGALAVDLLIEAGRAGEAQEALGLASGSRRLGPLVGQVLDWLEAGTRVVRADRAGRDTRARRVAAIRRSAWPGIERWGMGDAERRLLQALPDLLEGIAGAEDEEGALVAACRWLRGQTGAAGAAFVACDGGRVIASDGWPPAHRGHGHTAWPPPKVEVLGEEARAAAPVRYGGRQVGHVLVRGHAGAVQTLAQAAATAAPLCGSALRARLDAVALSDVATGAIPELMGGAPGVVAVREAIARAAPTAFPVLIEGESGTGKELAARALHRLSPRRDRRFCAINCAALTDDLLEAELFGHTRGAFTGAVGPRAGLFEDADGGTLFLDEVGELSARAQAKLLRALQEREIRRLGENVPRRVDVRVVAATNRPLADAAARGAFREDLIFRLAVVRIRMPPLRERPEDVATLTRAFWRRAAAETGTRAALSADALASLARHAWPGNVRELQNVIAGLALAAPARGLVTSRHVARVMAAHDPGEPVPGEGGVSLDEARRLCERRTIAAALARHGGRRMAAARELGLSRQGLSKAMRRVGLTGTRRARGVA